MAGKGWIGLLAAVTLSACGGDGGTRVTPAMRAYCGDRADAVEARIDALLPQLTLDDKVFMTRGEFPGDKLWTALGLPEHGVPALYMTDGPRGVSRMVGTATAFPVAALRGATFDRSLEARVGEAIGVETRARGRNMLLAPTMNILWHPRWGRAQETYGEDPHHMAEMALGFVDGAQREVPVTAKHYAVNSIEDTRMMVDVQVDERTLREVYLPHFERIVHEGRAASIMTAYNSVNGAFCSENPHLLRDILRNEWEYPGLVMSDWGGTTANVSGRDHTVQAATAGLDLEMFTERIYGGPLGAAVQAGEVDQAVLDEMVRHLLRARLCHGLDTNPPVEDASQVETAAHLALAREVARRGMVLLQNQGGALPLVRSAGLDVVVMGRLADVENIGDLGSSAVRPTSVTTALEGLLAAAGSASVTHIAALPTTVAEETRIASADAVVLVVGLTDADEGEGQISAGDRGSLTLPAEDLSAINTVAALSSRVILVVEAGSAIDLAMLAPSVEAIVMAFYPGGEGGAALADLLFGDYDFTGRLPVTFPTSELQLHAFDNTSLTVTYDYFHGYRKLDADGATPLYPFGFGLSYTTFALSNLGESLTTARADDTVTYTVDVANTGSRESIETVQLYAGKANSAIAPRFVRELEAFAQVTVPPGATRTVTLSLPVERLAYYDVAQRRFVVEPGDYRIEVGTSSRDLPLFTTLTVQ